MEKLSFVVCCSSDGGIGMNNRLIWHIPGDLQFFKKVTMGGVVVMGRKTFASIGNPLPGRTNVVLSRRPLDLPGVEWCTTPAELDEYLTRQTKPIFIIGGASLYEMYIDRVRRIYMTEVDSAQPADTFFPKFDKSQFTRQVLQTGTSDGINYEIVEYQRKV